VDEDSFREYSVKINVYHKGKKKDVITLYFSPKKNSFKTVNGEIKDSHVLKIVESDLYGTITEKKKKVVDADEKQKGYVAYVDGSFFSGMVGYGCAILNNGELIHEITGIVEGESGKMSRNVTGELQAVIETVNWCKQNKVNKIAICYDYEGIEKWATDKWKANLELTRNYKAFMSKVPIIIQWVKVKGHSGNKWNDYVDQLAKKSIINKK